MVILGHNDVTLDGCNYLLQNYMQRHIDYTLFQTYMKWLETFIQSIHKFNYHIWHYCYSVDNIMSYIVALTEVIISWEILKKVIALLQRVFKSV